MSKASLFSLTNTALLIVIIVLTQYQVLNFELFFTYQTHKALHLLGVCMFVGNVFVGPVWLLKALQSKNKDIIKYAFSLLLFTDMVITIPGIDLVVINGLCMASVFGGVNSQEWIQYSLFALFALWLLVFPILLVQDKMQKLALSGEIGFNTFKKVFILWMLIGAISCIPVAFIFVKMIYKN